MHEVRGSTEEHCFLNTPIGWLRVAADKVGLTAITVVKEPPKAVMTVTFSHLKEAYRQLGEYFRGERLNFNLPLNPPGTDDQRALWRRQKRAYGIADQVQPQASSGLPVSQGVQPAQRFD